MMELKDILYKVRLEEVRGDNTVQLAAVAFDSRKVNKQTLFVAIKGLQVDGHDFISSAIEKGATAIIHQDEVKQAEEGITYVKVADSAAALGIVASNFFGNPSEKLQLIGITGTNGKTTVATLLHTLMNKLGRKAGLISTVTYKIGEEDYPSNFTTPDPLILNILFKKMVDAGCTYCFMEVSSHSIEQKRIEGLDFIGAVFTNITHDHLDYHKTFDAYINAKKKLFDNLSSSAFALVNADDKRGSVMIQNCKAKKRTFSLKKLADYKGKILEESFEGLLMTINDKEIFSLLVGTYNAANLLAVYAVAIELGLEEDGFMPVLSGLRAPEGRFDYIRSGEKGRIGIVDYAHTPDALKNILAAIQHLKIPGQNLITVIGCGGNRDTEKRPLMARIAAEMSDKVVLTSDNPRNEDPMQIIKEMQGGLGPHLERKVVTVPDRKEAIRLSCSISIGEDIILVAGKGHEKYQEVKGEKLPFDDKAILMDEFKMLKT